MERVRARAPRRGIAVAALLLAQLACAGLDAAAPAPALWRVRDADSELFLFGTFHLLPRDVDWRTPAFEDAMRAATTTWTEADVSSPAARAEVAEAVRRHGRNPDGVTLSGLLGPERAARLRALAGELGLDADRLEGVRPWLAVAVLMQAAMAREGFEAERGVDVAVERMAREEGDAIAHFETASAQIGMFASLSLGELLADFDRQVGELDDFASSSSDMLRAWRGGDTAALDASLVRPMREEAPAAYRALIVDRNARWTERLVELLAGDGSAFVAVGAAHLVGPDGLPERLRRAGFEVERVQ
ncbi:MAG: TraB/GumN family protein [Myxococcales bacterium]|nr:TraB/GumN family protein [Myxococcales bacterium]